MCEERAGCPMTRIPEQSRIGARHPGPGTMPARGPATDLVIAIPSTAANRPRSISRNMANQQTPRDSALRALYDDYKAGKVTRRQFIDRAAMSALGIGSREAS